MVTSRIRCQLEYVDNHHAQKLSLIHRFVSLSSCAFYLNARSNQCFSTLIGGHWRMRAHFKSPEGNTVRAKPRFLQMLTSSCASARGVSCFLLGESHGSPTKG